jgi:hypothetical protein
VYIPWANQKIARKVYFTGDEKSFALDLRYGRHTHFQGMHDAITASAWYFLQCVSVIAEMAYEQHLALAGPLPGRGSLSSLR